MATTTTLTTSAKSAAAIAPSYLALVPFGEANVVVSFQDDEKEEEQQQQLQQSQQQSQQGESFMDDAAGGVSMMTTNTLLRRDITDIYESYASLYPNPALQDEYQQREQLLSILRQQQHETLSSSEESKQQQKPGGSGNGLWGYLFGSSRQKSLDNATITATTNDIKQANNEQEEEGEDDDERGVIEGEKRKRRRGKPQLRLQYMDDDDDNHHDHDDGMKRDENLLCDTHHHGRGLDFTCIPMEAHALARLCLASQNRRRINPCRNVWEQAGSSLVLLVGLGQVVEFPFSSSSSSTQQQEQGGEGELLESSLSSFPQGGHCQWTSDHEALHDFVQSHGLIFRLEYARGVLIGPNVLIVSWGLPDGRVQIYRRCRHCRNNSQAQQHQQEESVVVWQSVATCTPTQPQQPLPQGQVQQQQQPTEMIEEDESSSPLSLLQVVTDVLPLVVERRIGDGHIPAITLTIARLGGIIEWIPLSPRLWYGPELDDQGPTPPSSSPQQQQQQSYAAGLPNISQQQRRRNVVVALSTWPYHDHVLGLATFATRYNSQVVMTDDDGGTAVDHQEELYSHVHAHPPAEHVLIAHGSGGFDHNSGGGTECLSFWCVCTRFHDEQQQHDHDDDDDDLGFSLHCAVMEALEVTGPASVGSLELSSTTTTKTKTTTSLGPDWTLFATTEMMHHWRQARRLELVPVVAEEEEEEENDQQDHRHDETEGAGDLPLSFVDADKNGLPPPPTSTIATLSVSQPIVYVQCSTTTMTTNGTEGVLLIAILDGNGGVTWMDGARLERLASHTLLPEEYQALLVQQQQQQHDDDDRGADDEVAATTTQGHVPSLLSSTPPLPPLVTLLADRAHFQTLLSHVQREPQSSSWLPASHVRALQVLPRGEGGGALSALGRRAGNDPPAPWVPILAVLTETHLVLCSLEDVVELTTTTLHEGEEEEDADRHNHHNSLLPLSVALPEEARTTTSTGDTAATIHCLLRAGLQLVMRGDRGSRNNQDLSSSVLSSSVVTSVLRVAGIQEQSPIDIVQTLERQGKLHEALQAATQLVEELQGKDNDDDDYDNEMRTLVDTVDRIKQQLWFNDKDWTALQSMSDDWFVIQQALDICNDATSAAINADVTDCIDGDDEGNEENGGQFIVAHDLEGVRSILQFGLERAMTLASTEQNNDNMDSMQAACKIRGMLILLGTYQLLGRLVGGDGGSKDRAEEPMEEEEEDDDKDEVLSTFHFFNSFLPNLSIEALANSLAETANMSALSLLLIRHWDLLVQTNFDWLLRIPPTLSLSDYGHCLPLIRREVGDTLWFLADNESHMEDHPDRMVTLQNLPNYLLRKFGIQVVLDAMDEKVVIDSALAHMDSADWNVVSASLEEAYISRIHSIQSFTGSVEYAYEFSRVALWAMGGEDNNNNNTEATSRLSSNKEKQQRETLSSVHDVFQVLRNMAVTHHVNPFETLSPAVLSLTAESLSSSNLAGLLDIAYHSGKTWQDIMSTLDALRPLILTKEQQEEHKQQNEDDQGDGAGISSFCSDLIQSIVASTNTTTKTREHNNRKVVQQALLHAVNMCTAVALLSRTLLPVQGRLIGDKALLVRFVISTVSNVFRCLLVDDSLELWMTNHHLLSELVGILWCIYESLPVKLPPMIKDDDEMDTAVDNPLLKVVDDLKCILVALELSVAWNDRNALFACIQAFIEGKARDVELTKSLVSGLCSSYCSQIFSNPPSPPDVVTGAELLRFLISDLKQLAVVFAFGNDDSISGAVVQHLFVPLLKASNVDLLAVLSEHGGELLDSQLASRALVSFIDEQVNFSREREPDIQTIAASWAVLGEYYPHLESHFDTIQVYLDSAECLNGFPFHDRPKFTLADMKESEPIELIELLLSECPESIVLENDEWIDPSSAAILNKAIREIMVDESERQQEEVNVHLPRLPGQAVFQLAETLGLVIEEQVVVVKCRVACHALAAGYHGASAALCRNMLVTDLMWSKNRTLAMEKTVLDQVCSTILCRDYEDLATKRELCSVVLSFHWDPSSASISNYYQQILDAWVSTEYSSSSLSSSSSSTDMKSQLQMFQRQTIAQHSVDIVNLMSTIAQMGRDGVLDEERLILLSRYIFSWCTNNSGVVDVGALEWVGEDRLSTIGKVGLSLLQHVRDEDKHRMLADVLNQTIENVESELLRVDALMPQRESADEQLLKRLQQRGYSRNAAIRAATSSCGLSFDEALLWAVKHSSDPNFNDPIVLLKNPHMTDPPMGKSDLTLLLQSLESIQTTQLSEQQLIGVAPVLSDPLSTESDISSRAVKVETSEEEKPLNQRQNSPQEQRQETDAKPKRRAARRRYNQDISAESVDTNANGEDGNGHPSKDDKHHPSRVLVRVDTSDSTELTAERVTPHRNKPRGEVSEAEHQEPPSIPQHETEVRSRTLLRTETVDSTDLAVMRGTPRHGNHHVLSSDDEQFEQQQFGGRIGGLSTPLHEGSLGESKEPEQLQEHQQDHDVEEGIEHQQQAMETALQRPKRGVGRHRQNQESPGEHHNTTPSVDIDQRSVRVAKDTTPVGAVHSGAPLTEDKDQLSLAERPEASSMGQQFLPSGNMETGITGENDSGLIGGTAENEDSVEVTSSTSLRIQTQQHLNSGRNTTIENIKSPSKSDSRENDTTTLFGGERESLVGKYLGSSISKTLNRASPVGLSPFERSSFRQRGQEFLQRAKGTGSPGGGERQRLIEQGRELFARSRGDTAKAASPSTGSGSLRESIQQDSSTEPFAHFTLRARPSSEQQSPGTGEAQDRPILQSDPAELRVDTEDPGDGYDFDEEEKDTCGPGVGETANADPPAMAGNTGNDEKQRLIEHGRALFSRSRGDTSTSAAASIGVGSLNESTQHYITKGRLTAIAHGASSSCEKQSTGAEEQSMPNLQTDPSAELGTEDGSDGWDFDEEGNENWGLDTAKTPNPSDPPTPAKSNAEVRVPPLLPVPPVATAAHAGETPFPMETATLPQQISSSSSQKQTDPDGDSAWDFDDGGIDDTETTFVEQAPVVQSLEPDAGRGEEGNENCGLDTTKTPNPSDFPTPAKNNAEVHLPPLPPVLPVVTAAHAGEAMEAATLPQQISSSASQKQTDPDGDSAWDFEDGGIAETETTFVEQAPVVQSLEPDADRGEVHRSAASVPQGLPNFPGQEIGTEDGSDGWGFDEEGNENNAPDTGRTPNCSSPAENNAEVRIPQIPPVLPAASPAHAGEASCLMETATLPQKVGNTSQKQTDPLASAEGMIDGSVLDAKQAVNNPDPDGDSAWDFEDGGIAETETTFVEQAPAVQSLEPDADGGEVCRSTASVAPSFSPHTLGDESSKPSLPINNDGWDFDSTGRSGIEPETLIDGVVVEDDRVPNLMLTCAAGGKQPDATLPSTADAGAERPSTIYGHEFKSNQQIEQRPGYSIGSKITEVNRSADVESCSNSREDDHGWDFDEGDRVVDVEVSLLARGQDPDSHTTFASTDGEATLPTKESEALAPITPSGENASSQEAVLAVPTGDDGWDFDETEAIGREEQRVPGASNEPPPSTTVLLSPTGDTGEDALTAPNDAQDSAEDEGGWDFEDGDDGFGTDSEEPQVSQAPAEPKRTGKISVDDAPGDERGTLGATTDGDGEWDFDDDIEI